MLGAGRTEIIALAAAYVIAVVATPAGISGAVLLLPFQVSVLGTPSPAVTPTNLLYNVAATPGRCTATGGTGQTGGRLALVLIVPGSSLCDDHECRDLLADVAGDVGGTVRFTDWAAGVIAGSVITRTG